MDLPAIFLFWKCHLFYYVCCINLDALKTTFIMEANTVNPDQSAPKGAAWSASRSVCIIGYKTLELVTNP